METLADFGTVSFFGVPTFTTGIVRAWISFGDPVTAAQLSSSLLSLVFLILMLEYWSRRHQRFHHTSNRYQRLPGYRLRGWKALAAFLACALPLTLRFLLPASLLLKGALGLSGQQFSGRFAGLALNSITLAMTTAVLAVAIATALAYAQRLNPGHATRLAARMASLGYAVPGTVIAVGVLIPFAAFDNFLDAGMKELFGFGTGLLLTGSIAALVFAYLVRFMAVSLSTIETSLAKVKPSMDDAARALGQGPFAILRRGPSLETPVLEGDLDQLEGHQRVLRPRLELEERLEPAGSQPEQVDDRPEFRPLRVLDLDRHGARPGTHRDRNRDLAALAERRPRAGGLDPGDDLSSGQGGIDRRIESRRIESRRVDSAVLPALHRGAPRRLGEHQDTLGHALDQRALPG